MEEKPKQDEKVEKRHRSRREVRALTTDERASFIILSLYLFMLCLSLFAYWDSLSLKILGVTAASGGVFLFYAAFFNTEARGNIASKHPLRSYLLSFFLVLLVLFLLRLVGGLIENFKASIITLYSGLVISLIVFRKAMIQVISAFVALAFIFVTLHNWNDIIIREMTFKDAVHQCGQSLFRIGPIQDVANMLIAGNYMNYLNKVDYRDEQINILATSKVVHTGDDDLAKTKALLDFVSNEIYYVSDPDDGFEYAKKPINTLIAGGGDCEDQTLVLCSLLESVGVKTYIAFTDDHVFALVRFKRNYPTLNAMPHVYIENRPCFALDAAGPDATIGFTTARHHEIKRIFDVRNKTLANFSFTAQR